MSIETDVLIAGGGCAGLSLALALAPSGAGIVLVEPRAKYTNDRTWCFFEKEEHPWAHVVSHRWPRWTVRDDARTVTREAEPYFYQRIPSDAFYADAVARLRAHRNVTLILGDSITGVHPSRVGVVSETNGGPITAAWLFDSRPVDFASFKTGGEPFLLQHFLGWHVRTPAPSFNPTEATLMDFRVDQRKGPHFIYTLPLSPHEALVEDTVFSAAAEGPDFYRTTLEEHLRRTGISSYELVSEERGVIPMTTGSPPPAVHPRIRRIGVAGGAARPGTGYAFWAIQRQAEAIAKAFRLNARADTRPPPAAPGGPLQWLDRIFLTHLATHPEDGARLFIDLFEGADPARVVRFLADEPTPRDLVAIVRAMPALPLSKAAIRAYLSRGLSAVRP